MTDHVFVFGTPRSGAHYYQYARCSTDPVLYSGDKDDGLCSQMGFDAGDMFETLCFSDPWTFMDRLDMVEKEGKRVIAKFFEEGVGLCETVEHEKVFLYRPIVDSWKSFALASIIKRWHWTKEDDVPELVTMSGIDKEQICRNFISKCLASVAFYQNYRNHDNTKLVCFDEVIGMECNSPLIPTPEMELSMDTAEFLSDITPFTKKIIEDIEDSKKTLSLLEIEADTFQ